MTPKQRELNKARRAQRQRVPALEPRGQQTSLISQEQVFVRDLPQQTSQTAHSEIQVTLGENREYMETETITAGPSTNPYNSDTFTDNTVEGGIPQPIRAEDKGGDLPPMYTIGPMFYPFSRCK